MMEVLYSGCADLRILAATLLRSFTVGGKLGKGYRNRSALLFTTECESSIISKFKKN